MYANQAKGRLLNLATNFQLEAVLFDLDGTLVDTAPDFFAVLNQLLDQDGLPTLDYAPVRNTVSDGARALVELAYGIKEGDVNFEAKKQALLTAYTQHICVKSHCFDGISELLNTLGEHNIPWGIVTNKPEVYTLALLEGLGLEPGCTICPDHVRQSKPDPEGILKACDLLKSNAANTLYIGDHKRDIEAAKNAHCVSVAAAWGYIKPDDDSNTWQADVHCNTTHDLQKLVISVL